MKKKVITSVKITACSMIFLISLLTSLIQAQSSFSFNFNKYPSDEYVKYKDVDLKVDFGARSLLSITDVNERGTVGNKHLRAFYPKNKISGKETGFRFEKLMTASNEAVLEYRVKFDKDFDWSKGGKLPGLAGASTERGRGVYGCNDDRTARKKAFSTRLMWREGGRLIFYAYAPLHKDYRNSNDDISSDDRNRGQGRCGGDLTITTLELNKWYTIKQYIKLNTFNGTTPRSNGIVKVWIDGKLELNYDDFILAGTKDVKANAISFHTYRGGSTDDWASRKDGYAFFDDVKACTGCSNVSGSNSGGSGDGNEAPTVSVSSPSNNATFTLGETITIKANASDPNGNLDKVNFKINNGFYRTDSDSPFTATLTLDELGSIKIAARAIDKDGLFSEKTVTINVVEPQPENRAPVVNITSPVDGAVFEVGQTIEFLANANDADNNLKNINFKLDDTFYKFSPQSPATATFDPVTPGNYKITARATDTEGLADEKFVTITVVEPQPENRAPLVNITSPIDGSVYMIGDSIDLSANATDADDNLEKINFKINDAFFKFSPENPASTIFNPTVAGVYKIAARAVDNEGLSEEKFVTITVENPALSSVDFLKNDDAEQIKMYPNPVKELLYLNGVKAGVSYTIVDISGKVLYAGKIQNDTDTMNVSNFSKGVYFLKLTDGYHSKTSTFIKN